jgi:hypothetical protein
MMMLMILSLAQRAPGSTRPTNATEQLKQVNLEVDCNCCDSAHMQSGNAGAARSLQANQETLVASKDCFGDSSAGCCGSLQCAISNSTANTQVLVKRTVLPLHGHTYTQFNFTVTSITSFTGRNLDQLAMLFSIDTLAELSMAESQPGNSPAVTQIGCNPLDGYIAWRHTLPCLSCSSSNLAADEYSYSVLVKVQPAFHNS